MVRIITSVVYVSKMLKGKLEVIMHESACHGKLRRTSIQSSERCRMTMKQTRIPKARPRQQSRDNDDADCMIHNRLTLDECPISKIPKSQKSQATNKPTMKI